MAKANDRTTRALRDVLFDEIDELRNGDGDPSRALAVANLAKQIINVAKVELDFHREVIRQQERGSHVELGNMQLGSDAEPAANGVTGQRKRTTKDRGDSLPS